MKIKVFGREITLINPSGGEKEKTRFCDVVLTEEEAAYVYLSERFKFSILPVGSSNFFIIFFKKTILIEMNVKIYSLEIMGNNVDNYLANLKTNKLNLLKQRLVSFNKPNTEEPSLVPSLIKFGQPISLPLTSDNEE